MGRRRSLKGHVAACSTGFLRFLNVIVALGAVPLIVLTFMLKPSPTLAGWGLIVLGGVTILSGLLGTCTVNTLGCFGFHLFFVLISSAGTCAMAIATFVNSTKVMEALSPTLTDPPPLQMVKGLGVVCFFLTCFQLLILIVGCMVNSCGLTDYYEDLEADKGQSARELAKQQREAEERRAKIEATSAHQLSVKMKEKYGQWNTTTSDAPQSDFEVKPK